MIPDRALAKGLLAALAAGALLAGCSREPTAGKGEGPTGGRVVLCSTFPMTLLTRAVAQGREGITVQGMLPAAMGCPHDYSLSPQDMRKIAAARILVANGLGMETFLGEPLRKANPDLRTINTSEGISGILHLGADEHEEHGEFNPHLFASPRMAAQVVRNIAAGLAREDPDGAGLYRKNAEAYAGRLEALAGELAAGGKLLRSRKIVAEHAVFDYLARDLGLEIVGLVEETPGQDPSAAHMAQLVKAIRDSGAAAVFTEPQYPAKVGQTIAREAGVPVAVLDPVASGPENAPADYYEQVMRANLRTLQQVLRSAPSTAPAASTAPAEGR